MSTQTFNPTDLEEPALKVATSRVTFQEVEAELIVELLKFVNSRNVGKTVTINEKEYLLDHISLNRNNYFRSRGLSIYFRTGKSIIRISDHWAQTNHHPRSRKFNCLKISDSVWSLNDKTSEVHKFVYNCAKNQPWVLKAGKAGLVKLNKSVTHWM